MKYISGEIVEKGDCVLIERGRTPGRVTDVIEADSIMELCNVDEPGLMIESPPSLEILPGRGCVERSGRCCLLPQGCATSLALGQIMTSRYLSNPSFPRTATGPMK